MLGAQSSPCLDEGQFELYTGYRQFTADEQYSGGSELNPVVMNTNTQVISKMKSMDIGLVYAWNQQLNLTLSLPYVLDGSSNRALPAGVVGSPRFEHSASGIGDMTLGSRYWLMSCPDNPDQNIGLGLVVKVPTGDSKAQDLFPDRRGLNIKMRDVDQSIQPGDGGWGFALSLEAFKTVGDFTLFASGAYIFNPKGQNNTLSPPAFLNPVGPQLVAENIRYNTVGDSYIGRVGAAYPIMAIPGLSLSLAGRIVGVPVNDAIGDTIGFRRPGYYVTLDPGINYSTERATFTFTVPTRVHQYVEDSFGAVRDSTFADHLIEFSVSYRFGE
ncbi:MAG: hypothetical protein HW411_1278 [Gammaproteobacteria bacterium]|nr:hypothetical protein [Gammaproteobacteria bacterium]MBM2830488.1 hypothetical protein [Gammaproteobacteria bacterium]